MKVLGLSAYFHDAAAALVVDGEIVAAIQEERLSRKKQDPSLPVNAARSCLAAAGLGIEDLDHVVFYEKPLEKLERLLVNHLRQFPRGLGQFTRSMGTWLGQRMWLEADICAALGCSPEQVLFSRHHLSHAASAFLTSPFTDAAIVTVDGVGEWATTSIFKGTTQAGRPQIEQLAELHFPHSIGLLYSAITAYLGFEVNSGEYKVMGLAAYGEPRFAGQFDRLAQIGDDGSLATDMQYFCYHQSASRSFTPALEKLLGPARTPDSALRLGGTDPEAQRFADIAASLQDFTERYLLALYAHAAAITGLSRVCAAGGVALNSVGNHRLAESGVFDEFYVHPAAGDAGCALGAALYVSHVLGGDPRPGPMTNAFLGDAFAPAAIESFLVDCGAAHQRFADRETLERSVADLLCAGQIGGWFQGRAEWGPRALGGRSIIADPRGSGVQARVNAKIKFREAFRPFAPAVLEEDTDRWFERGHGRDHALLPFMCSLLPATPEAQRELPAVVHTDGSARVQTVNRESNPRFHGLISAFKRRSGVGVLLNTSMNLKDEPICNSPAEAYGTFLRSGLDFLVLEDSLIRK